MRALNSAIVLGVACVLATSPIDAAATRGDDDLLARFWREALPAWETYQSRFELFQGTIESTTAFTDLEGRSTQFSAKSRFQRNRECFLIEILSRGAPPGSLSAQLPLELRAVNRQYSFVLYRPSVDDSWRVGNVTPSGDESGRARLDFMLQSAWRYYSPVAINRHLLIELVPQPRFRIAMLRARPDGKVDFAFTLPTGENTEIANGRERMAACVLVPSRMWTLDSARWEDEHGYEWEVSFEFDSHHTDGFALPIRARINFVAPIEKMAEVVNFDLSVSAPVPPNSAFTLSAFDLPELEGARRPTPWYLYIAAAAITVVIIGAVVMHLARRRMRVR